MANDKYLKIDPLTGKPEPIGKKDGQAIPGVPNDHDRCLIEFENIKLVRVRRT